MDFRGHGDTHTTRDDDLSIDVMVSDVENVVRELYGDTTPIVLIGHSMGGAVAVHTAVRNNITSLAGLIVIDVVEGTALESLSSMQSFLHSRPKTFTSLEHAIEFCVRTGQIRNIDSARVSMVGQLKRVDTDETATAEIEHHLHDATAANQSSAIQEEDAEEASDTLTVTPSTARVEQSLPVFKKPHGVTVDASVVAPVAAAPAVTQSSQDTSKSPSTSASGVYGWRIDLSRTDKYWKGWFEGLSKMFLSCPIAKLLLLAGVDRLDKELTVGQMQGKFQLQVLPQCGHAVHEDNPDKVAEVFAAFLVRNRLVAPADSFHGSGATADLL
jgi:protein phosphatase methylesterase 1